VLVLGIVELFLVLIVAVPWLWVIYDALRWEGGAWTSAGRSRVLWILFIVLLPPFGVLSYLIVTRPELVAGKAVASGSVTDGARTEENPLLLMRRNTVLAIGLLLAAIAIAGVLGVLRLWRLA
jgi:hypothetical protein